MSALPRLLFAAPMSGSGKTTITAGLIAALTARGLIVAPFKCGPDYIDPGYHALAAGRACFNLDAWLTPPDQIAGVLARRSADADIAIIEGVMGLFDGYSGDDDTGSSAHIARLTATPVVMVLDARAMARTAAAIVAGLRDFDTQTTIVGVILNRVGSSRHARMVQDAIEGSVGIPVLGFLQRDETLTLPERHLGLIPVAEPGRWQAWLREVRARIEATVDLERVVALARTAPSLDDRAVTLPLFARNERDSEPVIAVARDEAFSFLYEENLDLLRASGARIAFFSPLRDTTLPEGTAALYLCGGFPELYAEALSANRVLLRAIRKAVDAGMPVYAECGGLMYLTDAIIDAEGRAFPMVGALGGRSVMTPRLTLGYRTVRAESDTWLWQKGETLRGHEFHYSAWNDRPERLPRLYTCLPDAMRPAAFSEGAVLNNTLASYIHIHFLACPQAAQRFVAAAAAWQKGARL
ncbi:cobyrinate a,c-diamide synthase [Roseiflexus castenholzii]|jgi:cobyrinic acid a,c-diamide synthase|uniref:Cobyrinate a,c-diamide synthase n=2 Tax=Chloroflexota TaxID=200795 RepID=A7NH13_ROSCS|nr:cobyrinate a,c-diamide synthase [Roseiflexus castenholzii]ABU56760.1 cobyrinic acid a,c-diamide synthase [Roseiflexus castenholzii DSM 13941]